MYGIIARARNRVKAGITIMTLLRSTVHSAPSAMMLSLVIGFNATTSECPSISCHSRPIVIDGDMVVVC